MNFMKLVFFAFLPILCSCKSIAFFDSPNNVAKQEAIVNMLDGNQKKGMLTISLEETYSVTFVSLFNNGKEERILIDSIKSYTIGDNVYVPRRLSVDFDQPLKLLFVKKLTPDSSRIQLYELYQNNMKRDTREDLVLYFISLPSFERLETWGLGNKNLVPNFDQKMSKVVEDCPVLAAKIRDRQKGYYFPQLTLSDTKKKDVLKKIINEYNLCK